MLFVGSSTSLLHSLFGGIAAKSVTLLKYLKKERGRGKETVGGEGKGGARGKKKEGGAGRRGGEEEKGC